MQYKKQIHSMKFSSKEDAFKCALPIYCSDQKCIGYLVPIGDWVLDDKSIIEQVMLWRKRTMRFFLTQFEVSIQKTTEYLKNVSIAQDGRLLFLIYDENYDLKGHVGVADVDGKRGDLDNMIRGVKGGHHKLIYYAEEAILHWAFEVLNLNLIGLRVLSFNFPTIKLHSQFGFDTVEKIPLLKSSSEDIVTHAYTDQNNSNVEYTCNVMELSKEKFESAFKHALPAG